MQIETHQKGLPQDIKTTAPPGVSVMVDYPNARMTRSPEMGVLAVVTLHFAYNVDLTTTASWLFDKLSGAKRTKITHNRINVELSLGPLRLAIEKESNAKEKTD